jgi:hypothetical protein
MTFTESDQAEAEVLAAPAAEVPVDPGEEVLVDPAVGVPVANHPAANAPTVSPLSRYSRRGVGGEGEIAKLARPMRFSAFDSDCPSNPHPPFRRFNV